MEILKALFWIATLCGCIQARPTCLKGSLKVSEMEKLKCEPDSTFYTPQNVKKECFPAALDCFKKELQTAKVECEDPDEYIDQASDYLELLIHNTQRATDTRECPCEQWPSTKFTTFLKQLNESCEFSASL